jgi:uncharacterized membrane protein YraQ (UPF0718 family)
MAPPDPNRTRWAIIARIVAGVIVALLIAYAVAWLFGYLYPRPGEPFYDPQGALTPMLHAAPAPEPVHLSRA